MAKYIDADKAVEEAKLSYCKDCNSYNGVRCSACGFDDAMTYIEDTSTADVQEVRHGEWIEGKTLEKCSVCGKKGFPDWRFCPHCGAKMDGEKNDFKE